MCVLALDLGASFIKGARVRPDSGLIEAVVRRPFPGFRPGLPPGRRETPLEPILEAVHGVLAELLRDAPAVSGLRLCGQMHGMVLVDAAGAARSDFISWQDGRALEPSPGVPGTPFDRLRTVLGPARIAALGNELRPGMPLARLHAMAERGELPPGCTPLALADYVGLALCGRLQRPATDPTNAAAHGALDVGALAWHRDALRAAGLDHLTWPEILPAGAPLGRVELAGRSLTVQVPIGDQQAALLGAGLAPGELSLNIATGSQVSLLADTPAAGDWQLRPFPGGRWLRTVTHLPAGRALNALIGLLGELAAEQGTPLRDPWEQVGRLAAAAPAPHLRANLAFFPCAVGDQGGFDRLREDELKAGPLFHAAFVSMAENYGQAARRLAPEGWSRIVFSGGLARKSPFLRDIIGQNLGSPARLAPQAEDTLQGLMQLGEGPAGR